MSRADDLRDEFQLHRGFLDTHTATTPAGRLVASRLAARLAEINEELDALSLPSLDFRVVGDATQRSSIPSALLTVIVSRFQSVLTWSAWAFRAGPGVSGNPPLGLERATATEFYTLAPASFRFGIRRAPEPALGVRQESLDGTTDLVGQAMDAFLEVVRAAEQEQLTGWTEGVVQAMGKGAARRLQLLVSAFAQSGSTVEITREAPQREVVVLSPERAGRLVDWLREFEESLQEIEVVGTFRVLDTVRNRFGIEDVTGRLYEGKAAPELLSGADVESGVYRARIEVRTREAEHTGTASERLTLLALDRVSQA